MESFENVLDWFHKLFGVNAATFSGAIDVVAVQGKDGQFRCTPFHVRFGKFKLLRNNDNTVLVTINDNPSPVKMKLGEAGVAFFVKRAEKPVSEFLATSPIRQSRRKRSNSVERPYSPEPENDISVQLDYNLRVVKSENNSPITPRKSDEVQELSWGWGSLPNIDETAVDLESNEEIVPIESESEVYDEFEEPRVISNSFKMKFGALTGKLFGSFRAEEKLALEEDLGGIVNDEDLNDVQTAEYYSASEDDTQFKIDISDDDTSLPKSEIQIARCDNEIFKSDLSANEKDMFFNDNLINYEDFLKILTSGNHSVFKELLFKIKGRYYPWKVAGPIMIAKHVFKQEMDDDTIINIWSGEKKKPKKRWWWWGESDEEEEVNSESVKSKESLTFESGEDSSHDEYSSENYNFYKSLYPTSEQLESMDLKPGANTVVFTIRSQLQGVQEITSTIYLWEPDSRIIISDIDGTITKSDVFGQILPLVGRDWSHSGVANLFSNIKANGYKILYLTARPIGQAGVTKEFLKSIAEDAEDIKRKGGQVVLPDGPVFMSPDRLLLSLNREVILRKPQEFKIACLETIKGLFESERPFYAGFGNRHTDSISYARVGVLPGKTFIINPYGEVSSGGPGVAVRTYLKLNDLVDEMFPPFNTLQEDEDEEFNDWQFWRKHRNMDDLAKLEAELNL
eukprot:TRINITY_DN5222_c0_g1_i1.p1 TRINITY_DN5222_c0_g1~~TRINITY_DN5222_c0_g1_i1.p1  ORF type:complete len:681 (-),score=195.71 TRINITY_DN5222_c0_g1_i1:104-2146(-)